MSKSLFSGLMALLLMAAVKPAFWGTPVTLITPDYFPAIGYDVSHNPLTKEGIELGRRLFYDPVLSRDSTISCASCHLSYTAFTHVDHALSHGIGDRIGRRNSPTLQNLAWAKSYMWDGAIQHLDFQALAPISDTSEMGETLPNVIQKLQRNALWPSRFQAAFGDTAITGERLLKAIALFELTLISAGSRYDSVMVGKAAFTVQEQNGYQIFKNNCARCHQEPLLTNGAFETNGLPPDPKLQDTGRMRITQSAADSLKFKVPTLRNIEFSMPYMHDGRFKKLREVLNFYTSPAASGLNISLTPEEKVDLTAFLLTLTDKSFLFNADFAFPRK